MLTRLEPKNLSFSAKISNKIAYTATSQSWKTLSMSAWWRLLKHIQYKIQKSGAYRSWEAVKEEIDNCLNL